MVTYKAPIVDSVYEQTETDPETGEEIIETISQRSLACLNATGEIKPYDQPLDGVIQLVMGEPTSQEALVRISEPIEPMPGGWTLME